MGELSSFRDAMAESLFENMKKNDAIVIISPDVSRAVHLGKIKQEYNDRFLSVGISEADMVGVAAGLATLGLIPVIVGFAMFVAEKPFEQIRNSVAYPNLNVKFIATHGGLSVGKDGATHQALEDIAILRTLPNMRVLTACDSMQTHQAVSAMINSKGPAYLRLGRDNAEAVYDSPPEYNIGKSDLLKEGIDLAILATGTELPNAIIARKELWGMGIYTSVINMYSIKPIDRDRILHHAKKCRRIVTVEDHSIIGGLGSAVSEILSEEYPTYMRRVGVKDTFGESGTQEELYDKYGLGVNAIKNAVLDVMSRHKAVEEKNGSEKK